MTGQKEIRGRKFMSKEQAGKKRLLCSAKLSSRWRGAIFRKGARKNKLFRSKKIKILHATSFKTTPLVFLSCIMK
jgi:hypothetical protein